MRCQIPNCPGPVVVAYDFSIRILNEPTGATHDTPGYLCSIHLSDLEPLWTPQPKTQIEMIAEAFAKEMEDPNTNAVALRMTYDTGGSVKVPAPGS